VVLEHAYEGVLLAELLLGGPVSTRPEAWLEFLWQSQRVSVLAPMDCG
jgi:hypothetical protein